MIVCFRCTADTKAILDRLVETGSYQNIGDAICAAVTSFALIEEEVATKGAIVIDGKRAIEASVKSRNGNGSASVRGEKKLRPVSKAAVLSVPLVFRKDDLPSTPPNELAELPADVWSGDEELIPLDRWVLGQFNRLLPAKANARALAHLFLKNPNGLNINEAASAIARAAVSLGDFLVRLDSQHENTRRDNALATAFPTSSAKGEKGQARYASQFVAYQNTRGELSGLMIDLKLINVVRNRKETRIVPTKLAWEFAMLRNPVLDGNADESAEKFSADERRFLLDHILRSVPVESFAYRAILEAVREGEDTPEKIDAALKQFLTEERARALSTSFVSSQRSGAVSRMSDLGLIERQRNGVRVSYALTDEGLEFISRAARLQTA